MTPLTKPLAPRQTAAEFASALKHGAWLGVGVAALAIPLWATLGSPLSGQWPDRALTSPTAIDAPSVATAKPLILVDFGAEEASPDVQHMANWVANSGDNQALFFVILDKLNAKVFVFNGAGTLQGASPVLIGAAKGDDSAADIGSKPVHNVQPHERTTPAGRFVGEPGRNTNGEDIVWVDYEAGVSMHRVRAHEKTERRMQRLAPTSVLDNRISYGCINLPVEFFESVLQPALNQKRGVIYILPEIKSAREVFKAAYSA